MAKVDSSAVDRSTLSAADAKRALLEQRLRKAVDERGGAGIPKRPQNSSPPLSYAQERIWFMEQFAPGTAAYGVPLRIQLGKAPDLAAFSAALTQLVARHESLRMRFPATDDGNPTVVVDAVTAVALPVVEVADAAAAAGLLEASGLEPFDLANGPLLRAKVLRITSSGEHAVLLDLHHIVTDGWSNDVILAELGQLYQLALAGQPLTLKPAVQYGDFAAWQREQMALPATKAHVDYWVARLRGVPALELPTDSPRPPTQRFDGASERFRIDRDMVKKLSEFSRERGATLFMTVLAAYQVLLSRFGGQEDFAIGSPIAGRSHPDLDGVVGMFNNMLPFRADLSGDPTVDQLIERVRASVLDGLSHGDVPFEKVINELGVVRDVSRSAVFQAMFVLQNYELLGQEVGGDGGTHALAWAPVDLPATRFDLELHGADGPDGGMYCRFVYNTALFQADTAQRLIAGLTKVLDDMLARPTVPISEIAVLDEAQRELLRSWNDTAAPRRANATLPGLFAEQVAATPDAIAVTSTQGSVTYTELDRLATALAHRLVGAGVGSEDVVAICAERSIDLVCALLAVQKAGAAYLPLDPEYPADRLSYMLTDSGAGVVLVQPHLAGRLPAHSARVQPLDVFADDAGEPDASASLPEPAAGDAAYVIYTSGSTGRPKGVVNTHGGIVNRLDWMQSAYQLGAGDVVLQKTPASFDVSVWEFFWPLLTGARLVMAKPGGHRDPGYLREAIAEYGVTTLHFVPSMLSAFLADAATAADPAAADAQCRSLRRIVCSGEELSLEIARRCTQHLPWARLHNLYGPTEAAVDVTEWECTPAALAQLARVPIGGPITNVTVHVLDERMRQVPIGAIGQLYLGGVQVARGYHRRPGLTAQRFVADPYGAPGARLYATGDLARWRRDATIEYLGRIDGQVKLRGLRIELGEIESVLREQPGVTDAAAAIKEPSPGDKRIVGYVVGPSEADSTALREALKKRLPDYMVPAAFIAVESLPVSVNGKLDRNALPMPDLGGQSDKPYIEPTTEVEVAVAQIWHAVIGAERIGLDDDFFALGGHSLLATQVVARMRTLTEGTSRRVGVMDLFQNPTVRGLAALISDESAADRPRRLLYELTKPVPAAKLVRSYVCVPYGGGSAVVYQPVADALPAGNRLFSVAIPGHDVGLDELSLPFEELARRCADEVLERVEGPLVLYGHCGVGGALIVEVARLLEADGREVDAVYTGGIFPFAQPAGWLARLNTWIEDLGSNRNQVNWLASMGVDMSELDPQQADRIISNMRRDGKNAEEHFSELVLAKPKHIKAPIISVVGERDPITDYYQERYREWRFITDTAAVVVLREAGHFFLRHRAEDLVEILTTAHIALAQPESSQQALPDEAANRRWWLEGVARTGDVEDPGEVVEPSMRRFALVSMGQLVSITGSALTGWALPLWLYLSTGSLLWFGVSGVTFVVPLLIATPFAGAVADRYDRRKVIMAAAGVSMTVETVLLLTMSWSKPSVTLAYLAIMLLAFAGTFQRITFNAATPQLVPKRYLGHANGITQLINGAALFLAPLLAAGLMATIHLQGILIIDVCTYIFAIGVLALIRFPDLMGRRRRESFRDQILGGLRLTWGTGEFRAMLICFGIGNLLYGAPVMLITPLVMRCGATGQCAGSMGQVGWVGVVESLGGILAALALTIWGGPTSRRMLVNLIAIAVSGVFVAITGLNASLPVVMIGVFGTAAALGIAQGINFTIIQTKIPQRFHGRVFALNQMIAWSTLPLAFAVLVPLTGKLEPLLAPGGGWAGGLGHIIGVGPGRGVGLAFVVLGLAMAANALVWLAVPQLMRIDTHMPDALPDDLIGAQALSTSRTDAKKSTIDLVGAGRG